MEENNEEQKVTNTEDVKTEVKEPANSKIRNKRNC